MNYERMYNKFLENCPSSAVRDNHFRNMTKIEVEELDLVPMFNANNDLYQRLWFTIKKEIAHHKTHSGLIGCKQMANLIAPLHESIVLKGQIGR